MGEKKRLHGAPLPAACRRRARPAAASSRVFFHRVGDDDDEPVFRFDKHAFKVGEYVPVTEHDGVTRPFRIVAVEPVSAA